MAFFFIICTFGCAIRWCVIPFFFLSERLSPIHFCCCVFFCLRKTFFLPPSRNPPSLQKLTLQQSYTHPRYLGIVCRRTFLVRRRTKCSSVLFVDVRRRTSTNIDEQVPATRATHDEQRRTSTNKIFFPPHDEHRRTFCSSAHYA